MASFRIAPGCRHLSNPGTLQAKGARARCEKVTPCGVDPGFQKTHGYSSRIHVYFALFSILAFPSAQATHACYIPDGPNPQGLRFWVSFAFGLDLTHLGPARATHSVGPKYFEVHGFLGFARARCWIHCI